MTTADSQQPQCQTVRLSTVNSRNAKLSDYQQSQRPAGGHKKIQHAIDTPHPHSNPAERLLVRRAGEQMGKGAGLLDMRQEVRQAGKPPAKQQSNDAATTHDTAAGQDEGQRLSQRGLLGNHQHRPHGAGTERQPPPWAGRARGRAGRPACQGQEMVGM